MDSGGVEGGVRESAGPQEHTKRQFYVCPRLSLIPDERSNHLPSNHLPPANKWSLSHRAVWAGFLKLLDAWKKRANQIARWLFPHKIRVLTDQ